MSRSLPDFRPRPALGFGGGRIAWVNPTLQGVQTGEPATALRDAAAAYPGRAFDVTAGNDIAVHWLQQPPAAVRSLAEMRQVAQVRCGQLYGGAPDDWWIAGDWDARRPFACAALPRHLVQLVEDTARSVGLRVRWQSAWAAALERRAAAIPADGWNAIRSPAAAMAWHCTDGHVDCIARVGACAAEPQAHLHERVDQRVAMERLHTPHLSTTPVRWHPVPAGPGAAGCEAHAALGWRLASALGST